MFATIKLKREKLGQGCCNYINKGYSIALMIDQRVSEGEPVNFSIFQP